MKLLAYGRASDVFDLGDGRVLRRFKSGGDAEREALVMRHAHVHCYPVPRVLDVASDGLVLERIEGPTMSAALRRRPWTLRASSLLLARLHQELHEIPAPSAFREVGAGDRLLHLDLHPDNVMLSPTGPRVIDWTNAHAGEPALDVALTWVILATSGGRVGRFFLRFFLPHFDRESLLRALPAAAEYRFSDPNVSEVERRAVRRLVESVSRAPSAMP